MVTGTEICSPFVIEDVLLSFIIICVIPALNPANPSGFADGDTAQYLTLTCLALFLGQYCIEPRLGDLVVGIAKPALKGCKKPFCEAQRNSYWKLRTEKLLFRLSLRLNTLPI